MPLRDSASSDSMVRTFAIISSVRKAVLLLSEFFLCCFHLDMFWRMQDPCSEDKTVRECWIMVHG
jgi:hypothetical protein